MKIKLENKKIIKEIKDKGYCILEDYFSDQEVSKMKNSLLKTLNYIKPDDETDLQKKYYKVKKYNPKLKGNWYDLATRDINLLQLLHSPALIDLVKEYFNTEVVFSGRAAIHVHDDENQFILEPHQETHQIARDCIFLWTPLFDTNKNTGGLTIFEDSHKHGYFEHSLEHPRLGKKSWTKDYTHVDPSIAARFKKVNLEIKTGAAVLILSSLLHCGYETKKNGSVRIVVTERYNPLQKMPYLKDENAPMYIPFVGVDYNKIVD